jgi:hypothetical protein
MWLRLYAQLLLHCAMARTSSSGCWRNGGHQAAAAAHYLTPKRCSSPLLHTLGLLLLHMYLPANRQKQVDNGLDMYRPENFATFLSPFLDICTEEYKLTSKPAINSQKTVT